MFWIGAGSTLIIFFSIRAYLNNQKYRRKQSLSQQFSRIFYLLMQVGNVVLVIAGLVFLMLAIVCHVKGFQIHFSSDYIYHIQID